MKPIFEPQAYEQENGVRISEQLITSDLSNRGFSCQLVIDDSGVYFPPQLNRPLKVYVVVSGQLSVWVNQDYFLCEAGSRLLVPPQVMHWSRGGADGCRYYVGEHHETKTQTEAVQPEP